MKIAAVKKVYFIAIAICLTVSIGCGGNDGRIVVKGTVSYDGQPIENGMIVFMPLPNESGGSESAYIVNGALTVRLPEGGRTVQVHGFQLGAEVASLTGGEPTRPQEQYIPGVYNHRSTLTVNIVLGMDPLIFDLEAVAMPWH